MINLQPSSYDYKISKNLTCIPIVFFCTVLLSVFAYGEPFLFWEHAFSDLGMTETRQGNSNLSSSFIYALGMITCSYLMFKIYARFARLPQFTNRKLKCSLAWIGAVGFLVSITPNNLHHTIHSIGIGCVIGSLFLLTNIFLFENREEIPAFQLYFVIVILYSTVLAYAYAFFVNSIYKQVFQKFCVMGLLYGLIMSVRFGEGAFSLRTLFKRNHIFHLDKK